jgi:hypothetical protein
MEERFYPGFSFRDTLSIILSITIEILRESTWHLSYLVHNLHGGAC